MKRLIISALLLTPNIWLTPSSVESAPLRNTDSTSVKLEASRIESEDPALSVAELSQLPSDRMWITNGPAYSIVNSPTNEITYIGGTFNLVGPNAGHGVPLSASAGDPPANFARVSGGSGRVQVSISDGVGGWFVAGRFSKVGGQLRSGIARILPNGSLDAQFSLDQNGSIHALALNPQTNVLYIGGTFTTVGGQTRNRIAAVNPATGQVLPWTPGTQLLQSGSAVYSLALDATTNSLFVGGRLYAGAGNRHCLAAVDIGSGQVSYLSQTPGYSVLALALDSANQILYVGGDFDSLGGQSRESLGSLNTSNRQVTTWNPAMDPGTHVRTLAFDSTHNRLYVGGRFPRIGGQLRHNLASIDTQTGLTTAWNSYVGPAGSTVHSLSLGASNTLYVGGKFSWIGDNGSASRLDRENLAAFDTLTGEVSTWNPAQNKYFEFVRSIAPSSAGDNIYIGGGAMILQGDRRNYIAAIDNLTGRATDFNPNADGVVYELAIDPSGNTLYAGGTFANIGGQARTRLAALHTSTGLATPLVLDIVNGSGINPATYKPDSPTSMIFDHEHAKLFVGMTYSAIIPASNADNGPVYRLASINTAVNQTQFFGYPNSVVAAMALDEASDQLYVAGNFSLMGAQARSSLASFDTVTNQLLSWNPQTSLSGSSFSSFVYALVIDPLSQLLYAGGDFTVIGGQPRNRLAAISIANGQVTAWNPNTGLAGSARIHSLALDHGRSRLYVGGHLAVSSALNPANHLMAVDLTSGEPSNWSPSVSGVGPAIGTDANNYLDYRVRRVLFDSSRDRLHVGGRFDEINENDTTHNYAVYEIEGSQNICPADFDGNQVSNTTDIFVFLSAWFAQSMAADFDGNGQVAVPDIFAFLSSWFEGC